MSGLVAISELACHAGGFRGAQGRNICELP